MIQFINKYSGCIGLLLSFILMYGCKDIEAELVPLSELGTSTSVYTVPSAEGDTTIQVLSNGSFDIVIPDSIDWLSTNVKTLQGDTGFVVHYTDNTQFPRMGYVVLSDQANKRYDTITIKQEGIENPGLTFSEPNIRAMGDGGEVTVKAETNLSIEDLSIEVIYPGEEDNDSFEGWVNDDFALNSDQDITFSIKPNPDQDKLRSAQIRFTYSDGWDAKIVSTLYLLQANAQNLFGTKASFADVRSLAGGKVTSDIFIEGYVVSDAGNKNVSDNPQTTPTKIDYTQSQKTVYVESEDGKYGFRIITSTENDNVFNRYSKVQLLLKGTTVSQDPSSVSYTIKGVTAAMVMSQVAGSAGDVPGKEKYISELTDDDIYTYVTLKDCELPIRKGSFTPVNEGYTILFNASRISKYPLLMRDIKGSNIFMMVNMDVPWRRTGEILPQGSGTVSGIIVHEHFTRFNYEDAVSPDEFGNIGRYQIRPLTRDGIDINQNFNNGFSQLLVEYQYPNTRSGVAYPTNNEASENGKLYASNNASVYASTDYTYLGPCGADNKGNLNQWGNGVVINGLKQNTATNTNKTGKGETASSSIASSRIWWDYAKDRGEAWILELSTAGISTNHLSLQFAAMNWGAGGPRYWAVEWSDNADMDGQWNRIATYTVPDVANWSNTLLTQLPGYKNMDVELPLSLLGKNKVYIRLIVDKNLCSDGYAYASEPISKAVNSSLSYLAVRYNK